jgi:hypothetical protein
MSDDSRKDAGRQAALAVDSIETRLRLRIRETIEATVDEELAVLGAGRSARVGRPGGGTGMGARAAR